MAYDIHITKNLPWFNQDGGISQQEWDELINNDPELEIAEKVEGMTDEGANISFQIQGAQVAKWKRPNTNDIIWLVYEKGFITVSNPNETLLSKVKVIAKKIDAKVQGDELEIYE